MRSPWSAFKRLPWLEILQVSSLTIVLLTGLELLLGLAFRWLASLENSDAPRQTAFQDAFTILLQPPLSSLLIFALIVFTGAIAILLFERLYPAVPIGPGCLWAIAVCLLLIAWFKALLGFYSLIQMSLTDLLALLIGVSWRGRRYWRPY